MIQLSVALDKRSFCKEEKFIVYCFGWEHKFDINLFK